MPGDTWQGGTLRDSFRGERLWRLAPESLYDFIPNVDPASPLERSLLARWQAHFTSRRVPWATTLDGSRSTPRMVLWIEDRWGFNLEPKAALRLALRTSAARDVR